MARLPLDDIRVVDLTVARAGPTCVRQLADWGADVIRVEPPAVAAGEHVTGSDRHGPDFQNLHRNKRSLTLDLKHPDAAGVLGRLVDSADVLVENMRPGVKVRLGFDWPTVHARNPALVYGSISGFGQDGPYAERGGVDQIAQGMGGLMSVTGAPDGEPTRAGIPVSDLAAGLYLAVGILAALHDRERTGRGAWVTTSLLEAMVAMMDFQAARWTMEHTVPPREGNRHPTLVPMGCFASSDGYVNIAGLAGRTLDAFCRVVGVPGPDEDPRMATGASRYEHRAEINAAVAARLATGTTAEWVERLNAVGVPCGPVYTMDRVFADPQVRHLGMTTPVDHPVLGTFDIVRNAVGITGAGPTVRAPSPEPGEHTATVLAELGYGPEEVARLRHAGAV